MSSGRAALAALLAAGCVAAAGCGSGGSSSSGTAPAGTAATTATPTTATPATGAVGRVVDGVPCQPIEQLRAHYHAHLTLLRDGQPVTLPALIGIDVNQRCIYWLHTHQTDGVIHIESPDTRQFTLGQFFAIWGEPLSHAAAGPLSGGVHVFVDGRPYTGDPAAIPLRPHELITIESGRRVAPPGYRFAPGL